jgi:hypothetical protein
VQNIRYCEKELMEALAHVKGDSNIALTHSLTHRPTSLALSADADRDKDPDVDGHVLENYLETTSPAANKRGRAGQRDRPRRDKPTASPPSTTVRSCSFPGCSFSDSSELLSGHERLHTEDNPLLKCPNELCDFLSHVHEVSRHFEAHHFVACRDESCSFRSEPSVVSLHEQVCHGWAEQTEARPSRSRRSLRK